MPFLQPPAAFAAEEETEPASEEQAAEDISQISTVTEYEGLPIERFFDNRPLYGDTSYTGGYFTLEHEKLIGSLYIQFQNEYGPYEIVNNDTGDVVTVGHEQFLHQFLDMQSLFGACPRSVTVRMDQGPVCINDLKIFTPGTVPDYVQKWTSPKEGEIDLILFSAHGDDEHLFFAGILPYYDAALEYEVLVVYLTDHHNTSPIRVHEILNGLWAVGVDTYPVLGDFYDFQIRDIYKTYGRFAGQGANKEVLFGFVVEQLRRYKPKVVVTHDFRGEYGHGQHMVYADMVANALLISDDTMQYPELAEKYGTWDVPKAYFHLYKENEIVMDWDQPLERFDGKTAFEVSVYQGFAEHHSQFWDFNWYYAGYPNAKSLPRYNPCYYGLYRSTVGPDVLKNDFFENVTTHAQDRQAEQERLEEEARLQAEEEARLNAAEEARLKAEEEARIAREKAEAEEQARKEAEALAAREAAMVKRQQKITLIVGISGGLLVISLVFLVCFRKKK